MAEVAEEAGYVNHHQKKIAFVFSAMRHFADELRRKDVELIYTEYDDTDNTGSLAGEVRRAIERLSPERLILTEPGEFRLYQEFNTWKDTFNLPVEIRADTRFLTSIEAFSAWAEGRKSLRMEFFYREARRQHQILMRGDEPEGGQWNYDQENRQPPRDGLNPPPPFRVEPDEITREVLDLVTKHFSGHFGHLEHFGYGVCREDALNALDVFIEERLPHFGTWQDAMVDGEPWMYHAHIGLYLNAGLLLPIEVIRRAEQAWHDGTAPLNAVEGFIRQILGWREYTHGLYHWFGEQYAEANHFQALEPLPHWFEQLGGSGMGCLDTVFAEIESNGYAHHIQRLMLLANYGLLAGLDPQALTAWFHRMFIDGFDWVMLTNVLGMGVFADGGRLASKPYAASGNYIKRMSNYCKGCSYDVKQRTGPKACPFNSLYWDFLARHEPELRRNHRMGLVMKQLSKLPEEELAAIRSTAANHRALAASGGA